jgi:hypothetical protein
LTNSGNQVAGGLIRGIRSSSEAGGKAGAEQAGFHFFQMRVYFPCLFLLYAGNGNDAAVLRLKMEAEWRGCRFRPSEFPVILYISSA